MGHKAHRSGLLVPDTVDFAEPELGEIAVVAGREDITRGWVDPMRLLSPQDSVLSTKGGGSYDIYKEVLRDDQVASTLQQRMRAVISKEWEVLPGGESAEDKAAAKSLEENLDAIRFDRITLGMLYGVFYGFAVGECMWAREAGRIVLADVRVRDRRRFGFAGDGSLRLKTPGKPDGKELPEQKFWTFSTGADHDDEPYGMGLAHWLYWPVFFKRNDLRLWLKFVDKFAQPTAKGTHPPNASAQEKKRLLQAAAAIHSESAIVMPEGMMVELVEAARSGTVDYDTLYQRMNEAISKIVLSQTMTTDDGSSLAQGKVHEGVADDVTASDADLVCGSFNSGPARWLTAWNHPTAKPPRVWRRIEDEPDLAPVAERDFKIWQMGFEPSEQYIQDTYGGDWKRRAGGGGPQLQPGMQQPGNGTDPEGASAEADGESNVADFAEAKAEGKGPRPATQLVAAHVEQLAKKADKATDEITAKIRAIMEASESLEEFREKLDALLAVSDLSTTLSIIFQTGLMASELAGRYEVSEGR